MATNYYLEKRTDKSGDSPIRVSINIQGVRFITSIGYNVNPSKWDVKKQKVKQGCVNSKGATYSTINTRISDITAFFARYESETMLSNATVTKEVVSELWAQNFKSSRSFVAKEDKTLLDYFDEFVKDQSQINGWTIATLAKFKTLRKQITSYTPNPKFRDFNKAGLVKYTNFLRVEKQHRNSSLLKNLALLRWFLRWTIVNRYNENTDFENFRPKLTEVKSKDKPVVFLEWDELMAVCDFDIPKSKEYLQRVRDVFCFCCFTSLRYSDVYNLKRSDIVGNVLRITTVKTSDSLTIELNKYSEKILRKYEDIPYKGDKALPVISNQKMNDYLKELGELCGINAPQTVVYFKGAERIEEVYPKYELLGTHTGRRTFICNALAMGIPANVVMEWTGHSDYRAMQPYIKTADKTKQKAMNKFDEYKG